MTQYVINIGAIPNDGTGDPLRTAFNEVNLNFDQVFAAGPVLSNIQIVNNTILTTNTNGNLILAPNGVGVVQANVNIVPNTSNIRNLGSATRRWSELYVQYANISGNIDLGGNFVINGDLTVGGNLSVTGNIINVANIITDAKTIQLANTAGTANAADGSGITVGANDAIATFLFNSANNAWATNIGLQVNGGITGTSLAVSDATVYGNVAAVNGNFTGNITSGNILPAANVTYSLGNSTLWWSNVWVAGNTIYIGGVPLGMAAGNVLTVGGNAVLQNDSNTSISTTGNITANVISATGNVAGDVGLFNDINLNNASTNKLLYTDEDRNIYDTSFSYWSGNSEISGTGNITAGYFFGNGSQLTGLSTSSISNGNSSVEIATNNGPVTITVNGTETWTFDDNGILTLAGASAASQIRSVENSSGDGGGYTTLQLIPDETLTGGDQYVVIDPTIGGHIHIRAGGEQDDSSGALFLGGEKNYVRVVDGSTGVRIQNEYVNISVYNYSDPADFTSATWYTSGGQNRLEYTSSNAELDTRPYQDVQSILVAWNSGANSEYVNQSGVINLGGGVFRVIVDQPPPTDPTVITGIEYNINDTYTSYIELSSNDIYTQSQADTTTFAYGSIELVSQSNVGYITLTTDNADSSHQWNFDAEGQTRFPLLNTARGDTQSGNISGFTLRIGDGSNEAIITTPDGVANVDNNSQRLVINPGKGADGTSGEGGDVYIWAGRGGNDNGNGGDVKIRGGYGPGNGSGGYIRVEAGDAQNIGTPGYLYLKGGDTYIGTGGYIQQQGGQGSIGGPIDITGGVGTVGAGGNVNLTGGTSANGLADYGNVNINAGASQWRFDNTGTLNAPGNISATNISLSGNITAGNFVGSGANVELVAGSYSWTFDNTGNTVFPGNTVTLQSSAGNMTLSGDVAQTTSLVFAGNVAEIYAGANVNIYANQEDPGNIRQWTFGSAGAYGELTLPTGEGYIKVVDDTINLVSLNTTTGNANSVYLGSSGGLGFFDQEIGVNWLQIFRNGAEPEVTVPSGYGNANLYINNSSSGNVKIWNFDADGDLSAPGAISAVGNITGNFFIGDGSQLTGITANTGNVTFSDQIVIGTGVSNLISGLYLAPSVSSANAQQYLQVRGDTGYEPTHIHFDTGNNQYFNQFIGDDNKYVLLSNVGNIVIRTDDYAGNSAQWNFGADGDLTAPGNITANNLFGNIANLTNSNNVFALNSGGQLNLTVNGNNAVTMDQFGLEFHTQTSIAASNTATGNNTQILIDRNGGGMAIQMQTNAPSNLFWGLYPGNITFPDGTNQTTAFGNASLANIGSNSISTTGNVTANNISGNIQITGNVQGTTANVTLIAGSYSYVFDNTGVATFPTVGGDEGGEINFGIPAANTTLTSPVKVDVYQDRIRFFDGSTKGAYIDLSQAATGVGTMLNNRVSGFVNAGTFVTMDNVKATVTTSGNRGLSLATVTGSYTYMIGATFGITSGSGGSSANGGTLTTTPTSSIFGWTFTSAGDISTYILTDTTNSRAYRITLQIGASYNNNMISIERLV